MAENDVHREEVDANGEFLAKDVVEHAQQEQEGPRVGGYERGRMLYMPRMKPGIFTGESDFLEWHSKFEICARLGNWPEDVKVMTMCASLEGNARKFFMGLGPEDTDRYMPLVAAFKARYASKNQKEKYVAQLEGRRRKPGESIQDLGDDIWHLAQRAFPEFDKKPLEILAVKYIYGCISNELRIKCIENKCTTVQEAIEVIDLYETLYETGGEFGGNGGRASGHESGRSADEENRQFESFDEIY